MSLTDLLEYGRLLLEDNVEVPTASKRPDWRLDAVAFATNDLDHGWAILSFRVRDSDSSSKY
jgi:hypothetical protein